MTSALHSQPLVLARTPMASAALLLVRLYMRRTGANARFDRTSYRWTSRHAAARGGHALLIDGGYPRSRRHPHSRRGHEPTCRRRTPAAHCRRPRRRPHRRRPPTRHFCAARASASPPPSHLPPARHRCLSVLRCRRSRRHTPRRPPTAAATAVAPTPAPAPDCPTSPPPRLSLLARGPLLHPLAAPSPHCPRERLCIDREAEPSGVIAADSTY